MKDYKEFTFGWLIFIFVIPIHILLTYLYFNEIGEDPIDTRGYLISTLTFILICLLYYGLTTKITSDTITVSFGIGLIRKKINLKRLKAVESIKTPWYHGWGIRIFPKSTLYNIRGRDAVELKFNDTDRTFRIGTRNSSTLKSEIQKRTV